MSKKKTVSLVLSSGGARGLAHVGVIEELELRGYEIAEIAGCSVGALVGGIYAAGKMAEFKDWICNLDRVDVFSLMDFTFSTRGFIRGERVYSALKKVVADCQIEDLPIPFACNAVDLTSGKEYIFREGSLFSAIRASASIPTFFQPARCGRQEFIDGGVLNPIPISLLTGHEDRTTVVVDLNGPEHLLVAPAHTNGTAKTFISIPSWLQEYRRKMVEYFPDNHKVEESGSLSSLGIVSKSFYLLQERFCELLMEQYTVDVTVRIARKQAGTLEFHRAAEMIEIGRSLAKTALDKLEYGNS